MSGSGNLAVKLPGNPDDRLESLARETHREQGDLIGQAVGRFLDFEEKQLRMIRESMENAETYPERLIDEDAVEAWVESLGTGAGLPRPQGGSIAQSMGWRWTPHPSWFRAPKIPLADSGRRPREWPVARRRGPGLPRRARPPRKAG